MTNTPSSRDDDSDRYLCRLSRLVRLFLQKKFSSSEDLWRLQKDLLNLQRDIQESITLAKRDAGESQEARAVLESLRNLRTHARRFGDAFAWVVLGMDRQVIYPLSQNALVAVPPDDHGTRGAIGTAGALSNEGWGFPLLHDITDCLRIGDMTFIKDRNPVTIEVKSRHVDERLDDDGELIDIYEATIIAVSEVPPFLKAPVESGTSSPLRATPRLKRQVRRMEMAVAHQTAEPGMNTIDDKPVLTMKMDRPSSGHAAEALRRVARRARRSGFATEAVDNTFLYAAVYSPDLVNDIKDLIRGVPKCLIDSGILYTERIDRNSIVMYSTPTEGSRWPQLYLPYFLFSLPVATIIDILCGRMVIFNLVNSGRIVEAIEEAGFRVTLPKIRNDLKDGSLVVSARFDGEGGVAYSGEMHNLSQFINEMVMEFRSLQSLIDTLTTVQSGMQHHAARDR